MRYIVHRNLNYISLIVKLSSTLIHIIVEFKIIKYNLLFYHMIYKILYKIYLNCY